MEAAWISGGTVGEEIDIVLVVIYVASYQTLRKIRRAIYVE